MSDKSELQQRAEDVLLDLVNKAAEIGSAAVDEIPLVVQELLTWKFAESLLWFTLAIAIWILTFVLGRVSWKNAEELDDALPPIVLCLIGLIGIGLLIFDLDWLQIWLAPRVYILEYAASLVKLYD